MKRAHVNALVGAAVLAASTGAEATLIDGSSLQGLIGGLYQSAACPTCSQVSNAPNVYTDQATPDELFAIEASGGSLLTLVFELAGNANLNKFGVYDSGNPSQRIELYSGAAGPGNSVMFGMDDLGMTYVNFVATGVAFFNNVFGYYLEAPSEVFYSQAHLNANGADQMVAYQGDGDKIKLPTKPAGIWGSSSFILAWEDIAYGASDRDFNDFVVYVESVTAVPEPGSLGLLSAGLLAFGFVARRRLKPSRAAA